MRRIRNSLLLLSLPLLASTALADGDEILGVWSTVPEEDGYAHVEIKKQSDRYHGEIIWLSQPNYPADDEGGMGGQPKVDRNNPEPDRRDQTIVGLRIVNDFEYAGNQQWKGGTIYDPKNGKTYKCNMKLQKDGTLKVRGYVGVPLLGRSTKWTRAEAADD